MVKKVTKESQFLQKELIKSVKITTEQDPKHIQKSQNQAKVSRIVRYTSWDQCNSHFRYQLRGKYVSWKHFKPLYRRDEELHLAISGTMVESSLHSNKVTWNNGIEHSLCEADYINYHIDQCAPA